MPSVCPAELCSLNTNSQHPKHITHTNIRNHNIPLMFFQFEMHGGIFQFAISAAVTLRGGECITGTGGEGGPPGTFLCLNNKLSTHKHTHGQRMHTSRNLLEFWWLERVDGHFLQPNHSLFGAAVERLACTRKTMSDNDCRKSKQSRSDLIAMACIE